MAAESVMVASYTYFRLARYFGYTWPVLRVVRGVRFHIRGGQYGAFGMFKFKVCMFLLCHLSGFRFAQGLGPAVPLSPLTYSTLVGGGGGSVRGFAASSWQFPAALGGKTHNQGLRRFPAQELRVQSVDISQCQKVKPPRPCKPLAPVVILEYIDEDFENKMAKATNIEEMSAHCIRKQLQWLPTLEVQVRKQQEVHKASGCQEEGGKK